MRDNDEMPSIGEYLGVRIHAFQPHERIETIVKPAIDVVHVMSEIGALYDYACDPNNPPEARLFAAAKCRAAHELASTSRVERPNFSMETLQAHVVGLDSFEFVDPWNFGALFTARPASGASEDRRPPEMTEAIFAEERRRDSTRRRDHGRN